MISSDRSYSKKIILQKSYIKESTIQKPSREKREKSYMPDGSIYEGEWSGKFRDGYGTLYWDDGSKYEGIICKNIPKKSGEWKNDKAEGKGKYFYANGDTYEGIEKLFLSQFFSRPICFK